MKGMRPMSKTAQRSELYNLLKRPIVTEKTTSLSEMGQYVFEVERDANKIELTQAFELAFPGRKVLAVRLITVPARTKRYGKRIGQTQEKRKAVFSIEGEPIELFTGV
jgi:large subunit ribosomal protein L23